MCWLLVSHKTVMAAPRFLSQTGLATVSIETGRGYLLKALNPIVQESLVAR